MPTRPELHVCHSFASLPTIRKAIAEQVDIAGSHLWTDGWRGYLPFGPEFISHQSVNYDLGPIPFDAAKARETADLYEWVQPRVYRLQTLLDSIHIPGHEQS